MIACVYHVKVVCSLRQDFVKFQKSETNYLIECFFQCTRVSRQGLCSVLALCNDLAEEIQSSV